MKHSLVYGYELKTAAYHGTLYDLTRHSITDLAFTGFVHRILTANTPSFIVSNFAWVPECNAIY